MRFVLPLPSVSVEWRCFTERWTLYRLWLQFAPQFCVYIFCQCCHAGLFACGHSWKLVGGSVWHMRDWKIPPLFAVEGDPTRGQERIGSSDLPSLERENAFLSEHAKTLPRFQGFMTSWDDLMEDEEAGSGCRDSWLWYKHSMPGFSLQTVSWFMFLWHIPDDEYITLSHQWGPSDSRPQQELKKRHAVFNSLLCHHIRQLGPSRGLVSRLVSQTDAFSLKVKTY